MKGASSAECKGWRDWETCAIGYPATAHGLDSVSRGQRGGKGATLGRVWADAVGVVAVPDAARVSTCWSWGAFGSTHRDSTLHRLLMSIISHASVHGWVQSLQVALLKKLRSAHLGHSHLGSYSLPYCLASIILAMSLSRLRSFLCL